MVVSGMGMRQQVLRAQQPQQSWIQEQKPQKGAELHQVFPNGQGTQATGPWRGLAQTWRPARLQSRRRRRGGEGPTLRGQPPAHSAC